MVRRTAARVSLPMWLRIVWLSWLLFPRRSWQGAHASGLHLFPGLASPVLARVLATDTANDLALLKGDLMPHRAVSLRVGVKIGEGIATFGYPLVGLLSTSGNFTVGNVSAITGLGDDTRYLQISAPVQPGNSGGPVLDQSGNVVGIVVSKLDAIKVAAAINDVAQNVNFVIKTTVLTNFLDASGVSYFDGMCWAVLFNLPILRSVRNLFRC
jgi:serine protease Do